MAARASVFELAERCADAVSLTPGQRRPPSFVDVCAEQPDVWNRLAARFLPAAEFLPAQPDRVAALRHRLEGLLGAHADDLQHYVNTMCNIGAAELEASYLVGVAVGRRFERVHVPPDPSAPVALTEDRDAPEPAPRRRRAAPPHAHIADAAALSSLLSPPGQPIEVDVLAQLADACRLSDDTEGA